MQPANATQAFNTLVQDVSFHSASFGFLGNSALWIVRLRYIVWSFSERKKELERANGIELGAGVFLNLMVQNENIRNAAKILLLISRVESCVKDIKRLFEDFEELWKALSGENLNDGFVKHNLTSSVPAALVGRVEKVLKGSKDYIYNVAIRIYAVICRLDDLLMRSIDAHEALYADNTAMISTIVNASEILTNIFSNTDKIFDFLETRRPMIVKSLSLLVPGDAEEKADQMMNAVRSAIESGRQVHDNYRSLIAGNNSEAVIDMGKRAVFGIFQVLNITNMMPDQLKPEPEDVVRARIFAKVLEQHPSDDAVRDKKAGFPSHGIEAIA